MVTGIRNFMMADGIVKISNVANDNVTECPMVKAVTKINT